MFYGKTGAKLDLTQTMLCCGVLCIVCCPLAGNPGRSIGPSLMSSVSGMAGSDLKTGLLVATIFPVLLIAWLVVLQKRSRTSK